MSFYRQTVYRQTLLAALLSISGLAPAQSSAQAQTQASVEALIPAPVETPVQPKACLDDLPAYLRTTVEQDGWTILQPQDLAAIDIPVWKNKHPGFCPGVASGKFRHNDTTYILALVQRTTSQNGPSAVLEKVVHVTPQKKKAPQVDIVVPPTQLPTAAVVWSLRPHRYAGVDGTNVAISHSSFVYEKLVSTARQYYYDGSHLKSFIISY